MIRIGSRESRLAVIQSEIIMGEILKFHPELSTSMVTMKTTGDKILDRTLDKIGGKGLFVKELDTALLEKRIDLAVHSLKDLPMEEDEELPLVGYSKREDPRDVLVLRKGLTELPANPVIGSSSRRRILQGRKLYPDGNFKNIRGNVITRLAKLDDGEYDGLILAAAGLIRLGLESRISRYFSLEEMLPSAGQGIMVMQGRKGGDYSYLQDISDDSAMLAAMAERAFVRQLEGGCSSPIAAYGAVKDDQLVLTGLYYNEEYDKYVTGEQIGKKQDGQLLGKELALTLKAKLSNGKVWLVGAGPGDALLLTLKGKQLLEQADVIVYDALVGFGVLALFPDEAKKIYVGKRSGKHTVSQKDINQILLDEALAGKRVVRLKGGDPFVFGRGAEELELLEKYNIPFEVVPGISSAIAVAAYAGIPVTHRDCASSLHIITGHDKNSSEPRIPYDILVYLEGTLVFLMGVDALEHICNGLIKAGMDYNMPAVVIENGTTARQRTISGTIDTLPGIARKEKVSTPGIIVVGKVCSLNEKFQWTTKRPLGGKRIIVTRPKELMSTMTEKLRELGAEVIELPTIETKLIVNNECLSNVFRMFAAKTSDYQWLVFTSPSGVKLFFDKMKEEHVDVRTLFGIRLAAAGPATAKALTEKGLTTDYVPEVYSGKMLGEGLAGLSGFQEKILILRAKEGSKDLTEALDRGNRKYDDVALYETIYRENELSAQGVVTLLEEQEIDYVVFTSASTVKGFVNTVKLQNYKSVVAICIGEQTMQEAKNYGMVCHVSDKATIDSMAEYMIKLAKEQINGIN